MNPRSLLDYLSAATDAADRESRATDQSAGDLTARIAMLEQRLEALASSTPQEVELSFADRIETILRRADSAMATVASSPQEPVSQTRPARLVVSPPPLAPDEPYRDRSQEFQSFVEAVRLLGQAAHRFLPAALPAKPVAPAVSEATQLADTLRQALGELRLMMGEMTSAVVGLRDLPRQPPASARMPETDAEFFQLRDDLESLRGRLGAMASRRSKNTY